jgi:GGDEF domain-containing protein
MTPSTDVSVPAPRPGTAAVAWSELVDRLTQALRADALRRALPTVSDEADRHGATLGLALLDVEGLELVADYADTLGADEALALAVLRIRTALPPWALLARTLPRQLAAVWVLDEGHDDDALVEVLADALGAVARRPVAAVDDGALTIALRATATARPAGGPPVDRLLEQLDAARARGNGRWVSPVNTISLLDRSDPVRVEELPYPDLYLPSELRRWRRHPVAARSA